MRPLFLIALLALIVFFQINGEKIPHDDGAFGDGVFYRSVGQTFLENIEAQGYNLVQLTRILPFALLNLSFSAFHIVKDVDGMRNGMIIWQLVYLAISIYWYFRICKKIRAKPPLFTLGFILLFFNFHWTKDLWYHPFSPDGAAFALGMGQANYFLRYEKFKLGMVSVLGIFVSPLLVFSGLLMLFLPGDKLISYQGTRPKSGFPLIFALGLPLLFAGLGWGLWGWGQETILEQLARILAILSLAPLSIWIAQHNSIDIKQSLTLLKKKTKPDRLNKALMVLAGTLLILVLLSGQNETLGLRQLLSDMGSGTLRLPLDFLLGFIVQWGLALLFTGLYLNRFSEELGKLGWAAVISIWMGMALLPFFSSATLAAWIPLWIIILLKGLKRYRWNNKDLALIGAYGLILSLAWLPLNSAELAAWLAQPEFDSSWAIQKFAIHSKTYRALLPTLIILLLVTLLSSLIYLRKKRYQRVMSM